jgi:hypothetical protein
MSHLHLERCWRLTVPTPTEVERPSDPLVGDLQALRPEPTDQGIPLTVLATPSSPPRRRERRWNGGVAGVEHMACCETSDRPWVR